VTIQHESARDARGNELDVFLAKTLTRRQLLQGAVVTVVGLSGATTILAACGSSSPSSSATAVQSGVTVGSYGNAETLDPMASLDGQSPLLWRAAYERLINYNGNTTQYEPGLAESWEISKDGKTVVFHLRPNVMFSDGEPMTASAWKLSAERQIAIKMGMAYALSTVKSVEAPDDSTFVVRTTGFSDAFISAFSSNYGLFVISPKAITDNKGTDFAQSYLRTHMVGTGPYLLESYTPSQQATFKQNPTYWRGWAGNHAKSFTVDYVHAASTAQLELESGALDSAVLLPDNVVAALQHQSGVTVLEYPSLNLQYIGLNCRKGPTRNKKVRQAIAYGFDYQAYVKQINSLYTGARQAQGPIPSTMTEYVPGLPQYTYDPSRAKQMLAAAGYPNGGFSLTCAVQEAYPWTAEASQLFLSNMAALGITVKPQSLAAAAFDGTMTNPTTALDSVPIVWWPTLNTPYDYLFAVFNTAGQGTAGYNYAYYSNPTVDNLMNKAYVEPDASKRVSMFGAAERLIIEDSPYLLLMEQPYAEPQRSNLNGFQFNGFYIYTYNIYDMYVA